MFYKNKNKNKINIWLIAVILTLAVFLNAQNIFTCNAAATANGITSDLSAEQAGKLVELTNQSRAEQGIEKITVNQNLISAAENKARDMFEHNYFAHTSPQELTPWHWIRQAGYSYQYAGENLAMDFVTSEAIHKALIASATHRKNILNPNYKEIGIAVLSGNFENRQTTIIVQMFGAAIQTVKKQKSNADSNPPIIKKPTVASPPASLTAKPLRAGASTNINKSFAAAEKINKQAVPNNNLAGLNKKELTPSFNNDANLNSHQNKQVLILPIEPDKSKPDKKLSSFAIPFSSAISCSSIIPTELVLDSDRGAGIQYLNPSLLIWIPNQVGNNRIHLRGILEINSNGRIKNSFNNGERNLIARHNKGNSILETVFYSKLMLNSFKEVFFEIPEYLSCFLFGGKINAYTK